MSGLLAFQELPSDTATVLYTVPTESLASFTLNLINTSAVLVMVRIALCSGSAPVPGEYIEYNAQLPASGVLERTGLVLQANKKVIIWVDGTGVNANIWGFLQPVT
jgi:hypothetical protein